MEKDLELQLQQVEKSIYIREGQYIKETQGFGNVYKGWDATAGSLTGRVPGAAGTVEGSFKDTKNYGTTGVSKNTKSRTGGQAGKN